MKNVILFLLIVLLTSSCKFDPKECPPGQHFAGCNKGCVPDTTTTVEAKITTPVVEQSKVVKQIPSNSTYKISDRVCVLGKWSGVVTNIFFSKVPNGHKDVLAYTVEYLDSDDLFQTGDYYDTQLERGECR